MCGRFVASSSPQQIADFFGAAALTSTAEPLSPSFNVAPTNDVVAIVADRDSHGEARHLEIVRWGLVPTWAKDAKIGSKMINARAETLSEKPSFKRLFRDRRLIIPMDGFYEWQVVANPATGKPTKVPMFIHRADGAPIAAAGLWSAWHDPAAGTDAPWLHTCTVITTAANDTMRPVHDRMPVVLPESAWEQWLDPTEHDTGELQQLLVPVANDVLVMHAVSTAVNSVRNKGAELINPA